jgi:hypothetical protein
MNRVRIGLLTTVLLSVAFVALAACSDDNNDNEPTATPQVTAGPTASDGATATAGPTAPEPTDSATFEGGQDKVEGTVGSGTPNSQDQPTLTDVRAAAHDGFDRIVFEFAGTASTDYSVEYVTDPTDCGSGEPTFPSGGNATYLLVRFFPAAAHDIDTGESTFESQGISPSLDQIKNAKQNCDFEAVLSWVVQLSNQADFRVIDLSDPTRLAVDVGHP